MPSKRIPFELKKQHYHRGAVNAWETRRRKKWKRPTTKDYKKALLHMAEEKLGKRKGKRAQARLRKIRRDLTHRFRSRAQERKIVDEYRSIFGEESI